jgi:hypothetical protein
VKSPHRVVALLAVLSAAACATPAEELGVPAVIVGVTPQGRAELQSAVEHALGTQPILLADDALTHESVLRIERVVRRDAEGRPLNGRDVKGKPQEFRLYTMNGLCILVHVESRARQTLHAVSCAPAL